LDSDGHLFVELCTLLNTLDLPHAVPAVPPALLDDESAVLPETRGEALLELRWG
jgi:hypothetical protein